MQLIYRYIYSMTVWSDWSDIFRHFKAYKKYGLFKTDFLSLKRTIRKSGEFIKKFISRRSFSVDKKGKTMILTWEFLTMSITIIWSIREIVKRCSLRSILVAISLRGSDKWLSTRKCYPWWSWFCSMGSPRHPRAASFGRHFETYGWWY